MTTPAELAAELAAEHKVGWIADDETFGARLALIRQRMQWGNVKEAALACGIPVESWRHWERDNALPRRIVDIALQISGRAGCDYIWLLTGDRQRSTLQYPLTDPLAPRILERGRARRTGRTPVSARPTGHSRPSLRNIRTLESVAV